MAWKQIQNKVYSAIPGGEELLEPRTQTKTQNILGMS